MHSSYDVECPHNNNNYVFPNTILCVFFVFIVLVDPDTPSIINGGVMILTGPSFNSKNSNEEITCVFTDDEGNVTTILPQIFEDPIKGIITNCKAICPMPLFRKLGTHNLTITVNGTNYVGVFEVGKNHSALNMYNAKLLTTMHIVKNLISFFLSAHIG